MFPLRRFALMALVSATAACSSSSFNSTWSNKQAKPVDMTGKKVLAVVQVREDGRRRASEDALAREITARGAQGIPSYTIFPSNIGVDTAAARRLAQQNQIAGIVMMRLTGKEQEVSSSPTYSGGYYGSPYYDDSYGYYDDTTVSAAPQSDDDAVAYCTQRYRSYDPSSGTYLGNDGQRHPCPAQ